MKQLMISFKLHRLQSLWTTAICSSNLQQKEQHCNLPTSSQSSDQLLQIETPISDKEMDEMILHCNQNTVYVLNTSYSSYGEFDMIGLFGTQQSACRSSSAFSNTTTPPATALKSKSKVTNMLLDNQINDKLKEVNNNLIKKRPHFLKFFNDNFFKSGSSAIPSNISISPANSCKSQKLSKTNQKNSKELYREAAQMLGMNCEFTENCRCLDCQSRYFDCDDDDDSETFSNLSSIIDAEEFKTCAENSETLYYCDGGENGFCTYACEDE